MSALRCGRLPLAACLLLAMVGTGLCGSILTVITPGPQSHLFGMKKQAEELASRGHNVTYLAAEADAGRLRPTSIPIITYTIPNKEGGLDPGNVSVKGTQTFVGAYNMVTSLFRRACDIVMSNSTLQAQLKELQPDLLLASTMNPCTQVLASRLDRPFINFWPAGTLEPVMTSLWPGSNRRAFIPNPLSYLPQLGLSAASQRLTYWQRVQNFAVYWAFHAADYMYLRPGIQEMFHRYGVDTERESERQVLTISGSDFAVEWLRPLPPDFKMVGPLLPQPPKPLPDDLEAYMEGAGEGGVLYVAMGTVATLGLKERQAMAAAFAGLPVRVLWRLSKSEVPDQAALDELHIGDNTKVVTWAPQNDILGHPRTRAFLSHCGANSMYEAAYHGVPIIGLPFFADQPGNADKVVAKGFGVRIGHPDIGTERFLQALNRVLGSPQYAAAAKAVSVKLRARKRTPVQEAADWAEHVLETKGEAYLKTPEQALPMFVRMSLDVYLTAAAAVAVAAYLIITLCKLALRRILRVRKLKGA